MNAHKPTRSTSTSIFIHADVNRIYRAFLDPDALVSWQSPGEMTAKIHAFDPQVGGGYQMSLFYPESDSPSEGKSAAREDRYASRYTELTPDHLIRQVITFQTSNPLFAGEMIMTTSFREEQGGTTVTIKFEHIPIGIRLEDNDLGTRLSLEKLASFIDSQN